MVKIRNSQRVAIHGHRGSRGTHPENTMASFEEALLSGADYFEVDLHLTLDDVPVVYHDPCLTDRLCRDAAGELLKQPIALRSLPLSALSQFDCGNVPQVKFPQQKLVPGSKIPTLEGVFQWMCESAPQLGINIEIKMEATQTNLVPDPGLFASKVVELIRRFGLKNRALVQSFDFRVLREVKRQAPEIALSCLFEKVNDFIFEAKGVGAIAIGPHYELLTCEIIEAAHRVGLEVLPWTINEAQDWKKLIAMGVDGIITDYPRALRQVVGK